MKVAECGLLVCDKVKFVEPVYYGWKHRQGKIATVTAINDKEYVELKWPGEKTVEEWHFSYFAKVEAK